LVCVATSTRAVRFNTPIDRALPLVVLIIFALSWCVRRTRWVAAVQVSIPIAIAFELLPLSETARLLGIGACVGVAFAVALFVEPDVPFVRAAFYLVAALVLLRWIPWSDVPVVRELLALGGALLILLVFRRAPARAPAPHLVSSFGIAVAILAALFTPAIPLRTVALPYLVAIAAWLFRRVRAEVFAAVLVGAVVSLFPWSGVVARGLPFLLTRHRSEKPRQEIRVSLAPSRSFDVWVEPPAESLILSGANVSRLPRGTIVGWIEPGHVALRLGDLADWGYMRRQHYFTSRNGVPRNPAGTIRDYGYSSWVDGAARVPLPIRRGTIRITADPHLPPSALLQVEAVELSGR